MALAQMDRDRARNQFMRLEGRTAATPESFAFTKPELTTALNSIDAWVDSNLTSLGNAISSGTRAKFTTQQRLQILCYVLQRRIGRLRADEDG